MAAADLDSQTQSLIPLVSDLYSVDSYYRNRERLIMSLTWRWNPLRSQRLLEDRLRLAGYHFEIQPHDNGIILDIDPKRRLRIPRLNLILFIATLLSVYFVPVFVRNFGVNFTLRQTLSNTLADLASGTGIVFTLAMISILFVHEMGHYIASRRRSIITSWPYFIPAPNIIGTFGAVIKSKSPFRNRRDLIEVGAAGPIAGWIVALIWLVVGLAGSQVLPPSAPEFQRALVFSLQGESILMRILAPLLAGSAPPGSFYHLSEAAFAGWVGLLVTAINLLPIGQLDGGHIIYGLWRRSQRTLGYVAMAALVLLGFDSPMWWVFALFGLIFGVSHPATMDDRRELSRPARIMGIAALVILVLSFTPVPFRL